MKYRIAFSVGYIIGEYDTKEEARKEFNAIVQESKKEAKRKWGRAYVIRADKDHAAIHATNHKDSPMWDRFSISAH